MARELIVKFLSGNSTERAQEQTFREFPVRIGRAPECEVRFHPMQETKVSALHAEVRLTDQGQLMLHDLESKNGLYLEGVRVQGAVRLHAQGLVEVGQGGPKLQLRLVDAASGISFAEVRKGTGSYKRPDPRPLVSTDDSLPAYTPPATPKLTQIAARPDARNIGVAAAALVLLVVVILYYALRGY